MSTYLSTESTVNPGITGRNGKVDIDLGSGNYLKMPAETARAFAQQILRAAALADGKTEGYIFSMEAAK